MAESIKISQLPEATEVNPEDTQIIIQGGVTKKATAAVAAAAAIEAAERAEEAQKTTAGVTAITGSRLSLSGDAGFLIECDHASTAIVYTLQADMFEDNTMIVLERTGDAAVSVLAGAGITITGGLNIANKGEILVLFHKRNNTWNAYGGII